jgi:hypothetical protein
MPPANPGTHLYDFSSMKKLFAAIAKLVALGLSALALVAWVFPSNVVRLISKEEFILLGRYGIDHFNAALILTLLAVVSLYLAFAPPERKRQRRAAVAAWVFIGVVVVFAVDLILRVGFDDAAYVHVGELRLRPPDMDLELLYEDRPLAQRSLPVLKPGYPPYDMRMRTDERGLRNIKARDRADVILLGDSFTEGSRVDDDDTWASRIERGSGLSVYNLANSGDDPQKYLAKFELFGIDMGAQTVIVTLYEGNDFRRREKLRDSVEDYSFGEAVSNYLRFAPVRVRYERLLRNVLGPVRANAPVEDRGALAWLPFEWRASGASSWYFVKPKSIAQLFTEADAFAASQGWRTAREAVDAVISAAARKGARVIVVYAPTKARVMFPLVVEAVDADAVLRYLQLLGERLPHALDDVRDGAQMKAALERYEGGMERVVGDYFRSRGIAFVSLTEALRDAARRGIQTYFTYDQHWTPEGHRIVAAELLGALGH